MAQGKLLALAFLGLIVVAMQGQTARSAREQTTFSEEKSVRHPVPLPPAALKALLKTDEVKMGLERAKDAEKRHPAQLFDAAEVHLSTADDVDLVVSGIGPMSGGDNDWFWVVRSARKNPKIILFAGTYTFEVMSSKTNGYRDIHTDWSSAALNITAIYKFNGRRYKLWKQRSSSLWKEK
jgi:hypothetical protein